MLSYDKNPTRIRENMVYFSTLMGIFMQSVHYINSLLLLFIVNILTVKLTDKKRRFDRSSVIFR